MKTCAKGPMIVACATVLSLIALNDIEMSIANKTPSIAQKGIGLQVSLRPTPYTEQCSTLLHIHKRHTPTYAYDRPPPCYTIHNQVSYLTLCPPTLQPQDPFYMTFFFFSSRRRHTRLQGDWSSDVCSSD